MVTMLASKLQEHASVVTMNMLKPSPMLQTEWIDEFGHRLILNKRGAFLLVSLFQPSPQSLVLTRIFTYMYFFILAVTLIILNKCFILMAWNCENNSTCKNTMCPTSRLSPSKLLVPGPTGG
jgi:hypothetical protein